MNAETENKLVEGVGYIRAKVEDIVERLDKMNGNQTTLFQKCNTNALDIESIQSTCTERHKNDSGREELVYKYNLKLIALIAIIATGGAAGLQKLIEVI